MIRKIETQEERQKKEKKRNMIIGIILGLIMLFSTAGYAFMSFDDEDTTIKKLTVLGVEFTQNNYGLWDFTYGGNNYQTLFTPLDTINITGKLFKSIATYYNKPLYFGINTLADSSDNGNYELTKNLQMISKSQYSCLTSGCTEDYPIKNCSADNVIIFKQIEGNISSISENNNCITLNYASGEEELIADALLFKLLKLE